MAADIETLFKQACEAAKELPSRPGNDDMLELYAFFKQGSVGDVSGDRPGFLDFVGGAKFDAWSRLEGMGREEAMQKYIAKVESLQGA